MSRTTKTTTRTTRTTTQVITRYFGRWPQTIKYVVLCMKYQAAESWPINWNLSGHWYFPPPMASILWPHGVLLRLPSKMEGTTCKKMLAKCAPTSWYFKCGIPGLFFLILSFSVNLSLYNGSTMTGIKLWISVAGSKWALTNIMNHPTKKKKNEISQKCFWVH